MADSIHLGPIIVYYYSLTLAVAVWVAYFFAQQRAKQANLGKNQVTDLIVLLFVSGIIGARIGFVLQNIPYFTLHREEIISLSTSGLSVHGGLVSGLLTLYWYAKKYTLPFLNLTDLFALPLLLGQTVGRLGNYFNQELFGYPTSLPWKIFIDQNHRPAEYLFSSFFHPVFAYEMLLNFVGFIILLRIPHKKVGQLTAGYLIVFSIARFITEIFRISDRIVADLSLAQLISLALLLVGIGMWFKTSIPAKRPQLSPSK